MGWVCGNISRWFGVNFLVHTCDVLHCLSVEKMMCLYVICLSKWYETFWGKPNNKTIWAWPKANNIILLGVGVLHMISEPKPSLRWGGTCTSAWGSLVGTLGPKREWLWCPILLGCEKDDVFIWNILYLNGMRSFGVNPIIIPCKLCPKHTISYHLEQGCYNTGFELGYGPMAPKLNYGMTNGMGFRSLRIFFPELYRIACVKDVSMTDYLELSNGSHHWNVSFIRDAYDWVVDVFTLLEWDKEMKTSYVGFPPRWESLTLDCYVTSLYLMITPFSLEEFLIE